MSEFSQSTLEKLGRLARIHLRPEGCGQLARDLKGILEWVEQLNSVDTREVDPLVNPLENFVSSTPLRRDEVTAGNCREALLSNAPEAHEGLFVVPKVVE